MSKESSFNPTFIFQVFELIAIKQAHKEEGLFFQVAVISSLS